MKRIVYTLNHFTYTVLNAHLYHTCSTCICFSASLFFFFTSSSSELSQLVRKRIKVVDNAVTWMEKEGNLELVTMWVTFKDEADLRLKDHGDADAGQDIRAVLTLGKSEAEGGKNMTITNRDTGR